MNRITPEHLARGAYVYIRQSTADPLLDNPESRRRQYNTAWRRGRKRLAGRTSLLSMRISADQASGQARPGFERLLAAALPNRNPRPRHLRPAPRRLASDCTYRSGALCLLEETSQDRDRDRDRGRGSLPAKAAPPSWSVWRHG
jgi:hypothetical protein